MNSATVYPMAVTGQYSQRDIVKVLSHSSFRCNFAQESQTAYYEEPTEPDLASPQFLSLRFGPILSEISKLLMRNIRVSSMKALEPSTLLPQRYHGAGMGIPVSQYPYYECR